MEHAHQELPGSESQQKSDSQSGQRKDQPLAQIDVFGLRKGPEASSLPVLVMKGYQFARILEGYSIT